MNKTMLALKAAVAVYKVKKAVGRVADSIKKGGKAAAKLGKKK